MAPNPENGERYMLIPIDDIEWRPADAYEALRSLDKVTARLREKGDARAVFLDVYAVITRKVVLAFESHDAGGFLDPAWMSRLTGRFAEEALLAVLDSLRREPIRSAAWRFATHYASSGVTLPYKDAILGVSAHVNHDLAQVLFEDISARGDAGEAERMRRYRHDYFQVNELLRGSVAECVDLVVMRYGCPATKRLLGLPFGRTLMHGIILQVVIAWRDQVWLELAAMLKAERPEMRGAIVERMDRRSGRIAQVVCAAEALSLLLRGAPAPFRLSRPAHSWPGVDRPGKTGAAAARARGSESRMDELRAPPMAMARVA
jgi:hypothetical protein